MDDKIIKEIFKRLDNIEGKVDSAIKRLKSLENNVNVIDNDLSVLDDFHLDHNKIHGELQTNTEHLNMVIDKVKENTKVTTAVGEDIIEKIEETQG